MRNLNILNISFRFLITKYFISFVAKNFNFFRNKRREMIVNFHILSSTTLVFGKLEIVDERKNEYFNQVNILKCKHTVYFALKCIDEIEKNNFIIESKTHI